MVIPRRAAGSECSAGRGDLLGRQPADPHSIRIPRRAFTPTFWIFVAHRAKLDRFWRSATALSARSV